MATRTSSSVNAAHATSAASTFPVAGDERPDGHAHSTCARTKRSHVHPASVTARCIPAPGDNSGLGFTSITFGAPARSRRTSTRRQPQAATARHAPRGCGHDRVAKPLFELDHRRSASLRSPRSRCPTSPRTCSPQPWKRVSPIDDCSGVLPPQRETANSRPGRNSWTTTGPASRTRARDRATPSSQTESRSMPADLSSPAGLTMHGKPLARGTGAPGVGEYGAGPVLSPTQG